MPSAHVGSCTHLTVILFLLQLALVVDGGAQQQLLGVPGASSEGPSVLNSAVRAWFQEGTRSSLLLDCGERLRATASPILKGAEHAMETASMSFQQFPATLATKKLEGMRWVTEALKRGRGLKSRRDRLTLEGSVADR